MVLRMSTASCFDLASVADVCACRANRPACGCSRAVVPHSSRGRFGDKVAILSNREEISGGQT